MEASAFSPCCITGAFRIHLNSSEPLKEGSTGVSLAIKSGVMTHVSARRSKRPRLRIKFNGNSLSGNSASAHAARKFAQLDGRPWDLEIRHASELPVGHGYGTSGAGTLGLTLAMNELMNLALNRDEIAQVAHVSEIFCRTGLGTVASVFSGGMNLRRVPGAPGYGKTEKIPTPSSLTIVTATVGQISTKHVLTTSSMRKRINSCSKVSIRNFDSSSPLISFMKISRDFFQCSRLGSYELTELIARFESRGFHSSMVMLGQSLFCLTTSDSAGDVANQFSKERLNPVVTSIAETGARLV